MKRHAPTIRQQPPGAVSEGAKAQWWRQHVMGLEIKALSELTGYSVTAIRCFEANCNTAGELFGEAAWRRYRMACAAVAGKRGEFEWGQ